MKRSFAYEVMPLVEESRERRGEETKWKEESEGEERKGKMEGDGHGRER